MTKEELEKILELTDIIDCYPIEIKKYEDRLKNIINIEEDIITLSSEEYNEIRNIDIPKQVIVASFRKKIEKAKQDLRNAIDKFNNIKLTTGFEQQVTSRARPTW